VPGHFRARTSRYLQAGAFVPEAVLEHPVTQLHRLLFMPVRCAEALTYYAHREKLRIIKRAGSECINRRDLDTAVPCRKPAPF
jgi:betaine-homocysteine S-methyltransferase